MKKTETTIMHTVNLTESDFTNQVTIHAQAGGYRDRYWSISLDTPYGEICINHMDGNAHKTLRQIKAGIDEALKMFNDYEKQNNVAKGKKNDEAKK